MRLMTNSASSKHASEAGGDSASRALHHLREALAEIEHDQWCEWSRNLAETEDLAPERLATWKARWVPYGELSEADKDLDRVYADRTLDLLRRLGAIAGGPASTEHANG